MKTFLLLYSETPNEWWVLPEENSKLLYTKHLRVVLEKQNNNEETCLAN